MSQHSYSFYQQEGYHEESSQHVRRQVTSSSTFVSYSESSSSEERRQVSDLYLSTCQYRPDLGDHDGVPLEKGQVVEVIDTRSSAKRAKLDMSSLLDTDLDKLGEEVESLLDSAAARHKLSVRPRRTHADRRQGQERWLIRTRCPSTGSSTQGWVPAHLLVKKTRSTEEEYLSDVTMGTKKREHEPSRHERQQKISRTEESPAEKRSAVVRELVETEEEFVRDLQHVNDHYIRDFPDTPRHVTDNKDVIFGCFKQICEFHNNVLIEGVKYYCNQPRMIGRTFLRLERDFDKHVDYCRDEPHAQEALDQDSVIREYFEELGQRLGDDKPLSEHLKLPIQRINDYQLLLRDLVKYSSQLGEDTGDLEKALEFMLGVPHRATDVKFINSIEGFRGNIHKLGRLLKHDWFTIKDPSEVSKDRYVFLFKSCFLVTKVRKISDTRSVFILKDIIRLPDIHIQDLPENSKCFELHHRRTDFPGYPLLVEAHEDSVKESWLKEIGEYVSRTEEISESDVQIESSADVVEEEPETLQQNQQESVVPVENQQTNKVPEEQFVSVDDHVKYEQKTAEPDECGNSGEEVKTVDTEEKQRTKTEEQRRADVDKQIRKTEEDAAVARKEEKETKEEKTVKTEEALVSPKQESTVSKVVTEQQKHPEVTSKRETKELIADTEKTPKKETTKDKETSPEQPKYQVVTKEESDVIKEPIKVNKVQKEEQQVTSEKQAEEGNVSEKQIIEPVQIEKEEKSKKEQETATLKRETQEETQSPTKKQKLTEKRKENISLEKQDKKAEVSKSETERKEEEKQPEKRKSKPEEKIKSVQESPSGKETIKSKSAEESRKQAHRGEDAVKKTAMVTKKEEEKMATGPKPRFTETIRTAHTEPGHKASFNCEVDSKSEVSVVWLKDNKALDDKLADRIRKTEDKNAFTLELFNCREEDSGIYTAKATNENGATTCSAHLIVEELSAEEKARRDSDKTPNFVVKLKDTELIENTNVRFLLKVWGDPMPSVTFKKDGHELCDTERVYISKDHTTHGAYELVITTVIPSDAGNYACEATNSLGSATCECNVTVAAESRIFSMLDQMEAAKPGEEATFKWFKDGRPYDPEERFKVMMKDDEDSLALVFQHVKPEDAGMYTCIASTQSGKISCSAELTVQGAVHHLTKEPHPPKIESEMTDVECSCGGSVMLEVTISGFPRPTIRWFKEKKELDAGGRYRFLNDGEENISLVIKSVEPEDAGRYVVVAENELGEVSTEARIFVKAPPRFTERMEDSDCHVRDTFKMEIHVDGVPPPEIRWLKDGDDMKPDERVKFVQTSDDTFALIIENVTLEDAGNYTAVAKNSMGEMTDIFTLTTNSEPVIKEDMIKEATMAMEDDIEYEIRFQGYPPPKVEWFKDDLLITPDGAHYIIHEDGAFSRMEIHKLGRYDAGVYKCRLTNEFGQVESETQLWVRCPPAVNVKLVDMEVKEHDKEIVFHANIDSEPPPKIRWYLEDEEIEESRTEYSRSEDGNDFRLTLKEATDEVSGKYTVKAFNDVGMIQSSCQLTVLIKPRFPGPLEPNMADEGESVSLTCQVKGTPKPEVKWYKDGVEVSVDANITITHDDVETYTLTIETSSGANTGMYEVRANNMMGETTSQAKLTINTAPVIETGDVGGDAGGLGYVEIWETEEMEFKLICKAEPKCDVQWYKDEDPLELNNRIQLGDEEGEYKFGLCDALPTDSGTYKIHLSNRLGEAETQGTLLVRSLEELTWPRVFTHLKDTIGQKYHEVRISTVIRGDPTPDIKWYHDGVELETVLTTQLRDDKPPVYTLIILRCMEKDAGKYTCRATNPNGVDETSCDLTVHVVPELGKMGDIMCEPFGTATFNLSIHANPHPDIKWLKDGVELVEDEHHHMTIDHESGVYSMQILDARLEDDGDYQLVATNVAGESSTTANLLIKTEKPNYPLELKDLGVYLTGTAKLQAIVAGIDKPHVTWYKNGEELIGEEGEFPRVRIDVADEGYKHTLIIKEVDWDDFATYHIKAVNLVGELTTAAKLSILEIRPKPEKGLRKTRVAEKEALVLEVKFDASPPPEFKWYVNGEELVPDDRTSMESTVDGYARLTIQGAKPEDTGHYKVVATNQNGEGVSEAHVDVVEKDKLPLFKQALVAGHAVTGQPFKITAQVSGFPKPEVKWMKDGRPVRQSSNIFFTELPDGTIALELDSVRAEDAGQYSVVLLNEHGAIEEFADLTVDVAGELPEFTQRLRDVRVVEGYNARLTARIGGFPTPTMSWKHNDYDVKPDGKSVIQKQDVSGLYRLYFYNTQPDWEGRYTAEATNSEGTVTSDGKLIVLGKFRADMPETPPKFTFPLKDMDFDEGHPLILMAQLMGNPVPDVVVTKDGEPLPDDERYFWTYDSDKVTIEIVDARPEDAGRYEVKLMNELGEARCLANIGVRKVFSKPKFTMKFTDVQQLPTFDAKFLASVHGIPQPEITWYYRGNIIAADTKKYKMKRDGDICVLFIRECHKDDAGPYTLVAKNTEGEATCEALLEVVDRIETVDKIEAPHFMKWIGDCEVYEGMQARFTACVTGNPVPQFEWFRNGTKVFPSQRVKMESEGSGLLRLIINDTEEGDAGKYKLRIFNEHGEAECEADLIMEALELRPKQTLGDTYSGFDRFMKSGIPIALSDPPYISAMSDKFLTLSWKPSPPMGPRIPVTYLVEMCELPEGEWFTVRSGIFGCDCEIRNLQPYWDYRFRVRVENKFGISDPSPYMVTHRTKLEPDLPGMKTYLDTGEEFLPETSTRFPHDYDIEKPPFEGYFHPPQFLQQEHPTQYAVKNHNCTLMWFVYGYPKPHLTFYFNEEPIEMGGRFSHSYTRNGQASLFVNKMLDRDIGVYECVAENEHGVAKQRVRLEIAEIPRFIVRTEPVSILLRKPGRLECRVTGCPKPQIKWYKDWMPLVGSERIRMYWMEPDTAVLLINESMIKDTGLYSCSARNVAGYTSCSAMITVEEDERQYNFNSYLHHRDLQPEKIFGFEDFYDVGDELGRDVHSVVYHCEERKTGRSFAAKIMHGKHELMDCMRSESQMMNHLNHWRLVRLVNVFETPRSMVLVTEIAPGGELVNHITRNNFTTEQQISRHVRQILEGLEYMHERNIAHLGLTPGDILVNHPDGHDIKLCDFSLARRVLQGKDVMMEYGMPEFVSPEIAKGDCVSLYSDMWTVGVITYLLLSGMSPFKGKNDKETLERVQQGIMEFDMQAFADISEDAKDFIAKLIVLDPRSRMHVAEALRHPWIRHADDFIKEPHKIMTDRLKNYYIQYKDWFANASCRTWYRRRPLSGAFTHPSMMVYPPGEVYTPEETPEPEPQPRPHIEYERPSDDRKKYEYHVDTFESESHYQQGPDTYLLQVRDADFPARIRKYMHVASNRSPSFALRLTQDEYDLSMPVIKERRKFADIMEHEISEDRKRRIHSYGGEEPHTLRRLRRELIMKNEEEDLKWEAQRGLEFPYFREKPFSTSFIEEKPASLSCLAVGNPRPTIQWYKNELVLGDTKRVWIDEDSIGRSILRFNPAMTFDAGIYKVVARNKHGNVVCKCKVSIGDLPGPPDSPEGTDVVGTEAVVQWKIPRDSGNSRVLAYHLQYKRYMGVDWVTAAENIDHEFFILSDLEPMTEYQIRVAAMNKIGWGDFSIPGLFKTKPDTISKLNASRAMRYIQQLVLEGKPAETDVHVHDLDYSVESNPIVFRDEQPTYKYNFMAEIARGEFALITTCVERDTDREFAAKLFERTPEKASLEPEYLAEFENLRALQHERIAYLHEAYRMDTFYILVLEKLHGSDVLTYLSQGVYYNENQVATIISQVLDGLQYLHWKGMCHLDIQPDNVVMTSIRKLDVKLVDLGSAQRVGEMGSVVNKVGSTEYMAPEMLNDEPAFPTTDMWSVGVLSYILLSGVSPFRGQSETETKQNISFVRFQFDHLYKDITQEAVRFIMLVFKRPPQKRPAVDECIDHRWFLCSEFMIKKRERSMFSTHRLKNFADDYHRKQDMKATKSEGLFKAFGLAIPPASVNIHHDMYSTL